MWYILDLEEVKTCRKVFSTACERKKGMRKRGWDPKNTKPSKSELKGLGLSFALDSFS